MSNKFFFSTLLFLSGFFLATAQVNVSPSSKALRYMGRIEMKNDHASFYWSGSSVQMNFEGEEISASLKDSKNDNYLDVIIDRDSVYRLKLDTVRKEYLLASHLKPGRHSVELFKITEYDRGELGFYGFRIAKEGKVLPSSPVKKRKIEYYGNSITCGYSVEDTAGDSPASIYENHYLSYAALTARHFNADYHCIAKSGIGITVSWFPYIMPDIYDRLNPDDPKSKWKFSKYTPDLVIINLFQNDSWLVKQPEHAQFKRQFGNTAPSPEFLVRSYRAFLKSIREKYPRTPIICALGSMDATKAGSPWPGYIEEAVKGMKDKRIYTHFFPYKNTPGHPKVKEQQAMAEDLEDFISRTFQWQAVDHKNTQAHLLP